MTYRVRNSSIPAGTPVVEGEPGNLPGNVDPNAVVGGARDRYEIGSSPRPDKLDPAAPVASRILTSGLSPRQAAAIKMMLAAANLGFSHIEEPGTEGDTNAPLRRY